jgi:hypothetical protein
MADGESNYEEYYPEYMVSSGIKTTCTSAIRLTEYYALDGTRLSAPRKGLMIRVEHLDNGQKVATKVIK